MRRNSVPVRPAGKMEATKRKYAEEEVRQTFGLPPPPTKTATEDEEEVRRDEGERSGECFSDDDCFYGFEGNASSAASETRSDSMDDTSMHEEGPVLAALPNDYINDENDDYWGDCAPVEQRPREENPEFLSINAAMSAVHIQHLKKLPHDASHQLYEDEDVNMTVGQFAERFAGLCARHKLPPAAQDDIAELISRVCPRAKIPFKGTSDNLGHATNFARYVLPTTRITSVDVCPQGYCCAFRKNLLTSLRCPTCRAPRYTDCTHDTCKNEEPLTTNVSIRRCTVHQSNHFTTVPSAVC
jgi:hypothetical protein